ncbi:MAG: HU domain-containing protein [Bacteroidia bacterium]
MKLISEHIRLLLHQNDCVVVPGLGGFIHNHLPAVYDEKEKRYYPSRALPFFNKQLQSNDGLLAGALTKSQGIDYREAQKLIHGFVNQVKESLEDKRSYSMPGLGEFQPNHEGQITFFPDKHTNTEIETYGLDSLSVTPLLKPSQVQRKALAPIRKKSKTWFTLVSCMAIIAFGGWWVNESVQTPFGPQWGVLNPFKVEDKVEVEKATVNSPVVPDEEVGVVDPETQSIQDQPETIDSRPLTTATTADSTYYIVVGAFKSAKRASRYERDLLNNGFSAITYSGENTPWIRVCAEKHTKRFEAEERLSFIRGSANPNAWILAVPQDIP